MTRESFLERWSRRKLDEEDIEAAEATEEAAQAEAPLDASASGDVGEESAEPHPTELIDIDALNYSSDFTQFMAKGVPAAVKRRALRKLWTSNPVLANMDGLNDYEDIVKTFGITELGKTGWKIGRGFLTDEDLGLTEPRSGAEPADEETAETGEPEPVPETIPQTVEDKTETASAVPLEPKATARPVSPRRGDDGFDDIEEM